MRDDAPTIVLDIEGTITPISFVKEVLFPYAQTHVEAFLNDHSAACEEERAELAKIDGSDKHDVNAIASTVHRLIDDDVKHTALKSLQGKIWRAGYEEGGLVAPMFEDVASFFAANAPIYIYSSGSIAAQKLLLRYSDAGDLTPHVAGYFDTTIGSKLERSSYESIAQEVGASRFVFGSDNIQELEAAAAAGWEVAHFVRPGNPPAGNVSFTQVDDLVAFARLL